ncbi:MAG: hypothetical protein OXI01_23740 [Albidovulum sp.]|nr:hypothetical protein [Albidovulum sp.]
MFVTAPDWIVPYLDWVVPSLISGIFTLAVTLLVVVVRNRRVLLTYHVTHYRIGISALDEIHGEVAVTVGGNPVQNLYMSNIWLVNRSMRDVEDLEIKVFCRVEDMHLMSEQTHVEGTVDYLRHTAEFDEIKSQLTNAFGEVENARVAGDHAKTQMLDRTIESNWRTFSTSRWYAVPVLARGQAVRFAYMTNVLSDASPEIFISCQKAGVRLKYKEPYQPVWHLWGVSLADAGLVGIAISTVIWILVISSISTLWLAALICLVAGLLSSVPGAGVVKLYWWVRIRLIG